MLQTHIEKTTDRWAQGLAHAQFDAVWIAAGNDHLHFQDDHGPAFKPHPFFTQFVDPTYAHAGAQCLVRPGQKPQLFLLQPTDYWHAVSPLPEYLNDWVDLHVFSDQSSLDKACRDAVQPNERCAFVGEVLNKDTDNELLGTPNDERLLAYMSFHRARKTEYELQAMRIASEVGVRGHIAAEEAFRAGKAEFDIHMAYLAASSQTDLELPYGNIVALNEHGATLHYQLHDRQPPAQHRSLLIDAGGEHLGYASDITRTYAIDTESSFADLIDLMQSHQDAILAEVSPSRTFASLHVFMHENLARVLESANLITCSAEDALEMGITEKFCPHGLGHLLGIQVHDVGGHLANEDGDAAPPPDNYPTLRFTRQIETDQVFTIEPGIYFIDSMIKSLRDDDAPINWQTLEALYPYGGVRIEDNVRVLEQGHENLTRDAWQRVTANG